MSVRAGLLVYLSVAAGALGVFAGLVAGTDPEGWRMIRRGVSLLILVALLGALAVLLVVDP